MTLDARIITEFHSSGLPCAGLFGSVLSTLLFRSGSKTDAADDYGDRRGAFGGFKLSGHSGVLFLADTPAISAPAGFLTETN